MLFQNYTKQEVGWYVLMVAFAFGPVSILATAIAQSFWGEAARLIRNNQIGDLKNLYLRITSRLVFLSLGLIVICVAGPWFVGPLLGEEKWGGAGTVLVMMTPAIVGTFIFSSTNHLVVYGKQKWQLISDLISLVLSLLSIYIAKQNEVNFELTILIYSIVIFFTYIIRFIFHLKAIKCYVRKNELL